MSGHPVKLAVGGPKHGDFLYPHEKIDWTERSQTADGDVEFDLTVYYRRELDLPTGTVTIMLAEDDLPASDEPDFELLRFYADALTIAAQRMAQAAADFTTRQRQLAAILSGADIQADHLVRATER
jgi:hypothetical protein